MKNWIRNLEYRLPAGWFSFALWLIVPFCLATGRADDPFFFILLALLFADKILNMGQIYFMIATLKGIQLELRRMMKTQQMVREATMKSRESDG